NADVIARRAPKDCYVSDPLLAFWLIQTLNWLKLIELCYPPLYGSRSVAVKLTELGETIEV
ncbi:MAG: hypothetical protein P8X89_16240, partial [Reinekea sp.]